MSELWLVEFSLVMKDITEKTSTPGIDGEVIVRGYDIFDVLDKARSKLNTFGFDDVIIHSAHRGGYDKKGAKENG